MNPLLALLSWLFLRLLRLYPAAYRLQFEEELIDVYAQIIQESTDGRRNVFRALQELRDFPGVWLRVHLRRSTSAMSRFPFPPTSDQTPWPTALLSMVPLIFLGPAVLITLYHPWPATPEYAWVDSLLKTLKYVLIGAGAVIGVLRGFPRWSYPYAVTVCLWLAFGLGPGLFARFSSSESDLLAWLLFLLIVLVTRWLPPFRPFYTNLRGDWTLLSYGMYACAILLFSTQDRDEAPRLTFFVLLPTLLTIAGALAHLRLPKAEHKIAVLVASILPGAFLFWAPVFSGAPTTLIGILLVGGMTLLFSGVLTALVLAPMLLGIWANRAKTA